MSNLASFFNFAIVHKPGRRFRNELAKNDGSRGKDGAHEADPPPGQDGAKDVDKRDAGTDEQWTTAGEEGSEQE